MPRPPYVNSHISAMPNGVFSKFSSTISNLRGVIYPLHIGDTYFEPLEGARMEDIRTEQIAGVHRYTKSEGLPALIEKISEKRNVDQNRILVTAGATGGLHVVAMTLLAPGDEVLILAPYWPLIAGIVRSVGATPVEVPFFDREGSISDRVEPFITERTVALYVNSPNNPTGMILDPFQGIELGMLARKHNLWLWSDEVYEQLQFNGTPIDFSEIVPERAFRVFSFSKAYGMAGNRVGYILGPSDPGLTLELSKSQKHAYYSVTTAAQYAAIHILDHGEPWLLKARRAYLEIGKEVAERLEMPIPMGGTFLFMDVTKYLDETGADGFLSECISHNLLLAPGESFGKSYANFIRICFTSASPDLVRQGVQVLQKVIQRRKN
jgi:N-succinyldiaminopimelate aminotransferase